MENPTWKLIKYGNGTQLVLVCKQHKNKFACMRFNAKSLTWGLATNKADHVDIKIDDPRWIRDCTAAEAKAIILEACDRVKPDMPQEFHVRADGFRMYADALVE